MVPAAVALIINGRQLVVISAESVATIKFRIHIFTTGIMLLVPGVVLAVAVIPGAVPGAIVAPPIRGNAVDRVGTVIAVAVKYRAPINTAVVIALVPGIISAIAVIPGAVPGAIFFPPS
jgi:hypothetical protein